MPVPIVASAVLNKLILVYIALILVDRKQLIKLYGRSQIHSSGIITAQFSFLNLKLIGFFGMLCVESSRLSFFIN